MWQRDRTPEHSVAQDSVVWAFHNILSVFTTPSLPALLFPVFNRSNQPRELRLLLFGPQALLFGDLLVEESEDTRAAR